MTAYIKKSSILNINNQESRWYYFTKDDLDNHKTELLNDLGHILGMSQDAIINYSPHFQRLKTDGFININANRGMNTIEPERIILRNEGFHIYKNKELKINEGLSGYLMPDGNFFWANSKGHSSLLQELLELDNYKNYFKSNELSLYFSKHDGGIVCFDDKPAAWTEPTLSNIAKDSLTKLQKYMNENQRNILNEIIE